MKAAFALEVRDKRLSFDRDHIRALLKGARGLAGGAAAAVIQGLHRLGFPMAGLPSDAMAALSRGELPAGLFFTDSPSMSGEAGVPVGLSIAAGMPIVAGQVSYLRFRAENYTDKKLRCHIDPAVYGLKLVFERDQSWTENRSGIPTVSVESGGSQLVDFSFVANRPGQYRSGDIIIEVIENNTKHTWFRIPAGTLTFNVGTGEGKSVIVNAEVMAGDVYADRDRGGIGLNHDWVSLPIEKAPPPPGIGLPDRLEVPSAGSMRWVARAMLSWYSEEGSKTELHRRFVFGGDSVKMGRKAPLLVRDPNDPGRYETNGCISKLHAILTISSDRNIASVTDLGSTNGTYLVEKDPNSVAEREVCLAKHRQYGLENLCQFRLAAKESPFSVLFECRVFRQMRRRGEVLAIRLRRRDRQNHEYIVVPQRAFIGSGRGAAIRLNSNDMPAFCGVLEWQDCGFVIGPATPDARILVNGERIEFGTAASIASGAEIDVKGVRITFEQATDSHFKEPSRT